MTAARYLEGRLQSTHEQCPGREPDMSPAAANAMVAALRAASGGIEKWLALRKLRSDPSGTVCGAAAMHTPAARDEAAKVCSGLEPADEPRRAPTSPDEP